MRGSLTAAATKSQKSASETGAVDVVQASSIGFMARCLQDLLSHAPYAPTQQTDLWTWSTQFTQWPFDADHITVWYQISYDGVDFRKRLPSTRGIVLLLFYLAFDDSNDRPQAAARR